MKKSILALLPVLAGCTPSVICTPSPGARDVCIDTHIILTFNEEPTPGSEGMIRIFDLGTGECIDSLDMSLPAGLTEPRSYPPDIDYTKVPYDYSPRTFIPTNRNTLPGTPSGTAEPTPRDMQLTIIGGFTDGFRFHPVIVHGNTATIYPHNNMLEYGHRYKVTIDDSVFGRKIRPWTFTTKSEGPANPRELLVDASGKGDFCTVQGALDAIPDACPELTTVTVAPGDYEELVYARCKRNLHIRGGGKDVTKVHYPNNEVFNPHPMTVKNNEKEGAFPYRRAAFALDHCDDVIIEDITIATDLKGQAEGLLLNGDRVALYDVRIIGDGDALQANGTIYLEDCEIDGGYDAILGRGSVYLLHCYLHNSGGPFTWVRNFKPAHGDVFVECTFESTGDKPIDYGRTQTNHGSSYPDAELVMIDCKARNLLPAGWSSIGEPTAVMLELDTRDLDSGEPVDVSARHPYSRQLDRKKDAELIKNYRTPSYVLGGWTPSRQ